MPYDTPCTCTCAYLFLQSPWFSWFIIVTIYLNALFIGLETIPLSGLVPYLDMAVYNIFLGIYLLEFAIKLCAEPLGYWKQYHNLFDLVILVALVVHCLLFELETGRKGIMALKAIRGTTKINSKLNILCLENWFFSNKVNVYSSSLKLLHHIITFTHYFAFAFVHISC